MKHLLPQLATGIPLTVEQTVEAFDAIMTGQVPPTQIAAMLAMMQVRGPHVDELTGAATVMRAKVRPAVVPIGVEAIDIVGTGGDHGGTFNISTAAALVAAAVGRPRNVVVAKHGNRSVTSKSGASEVLDTLGVKLDIADQVQTRCLDEAGMCFCYAPMHHPAMKHVAPVRQELGFRTLFNLLGPLTNPAGVQKQVLGVFAAELTEPLANVLMKLGAAHAMVVHGILDAHTGLDELITCGPTRISHLRDGQINSYQLDPASLMLKPARLSELQVEGPGQSAERIEQVLAGKRGPARDVVCLNAAAALVIADLAADLSEGMDLARDAVDSGAARQVLDKLKQITHEQ